jgi:hypothetical protein
MHHTITQTTRKIIVLCELIIRIEAIKLMLCVWVLCVHETARGPQLMKSLTS